MTKTDNFILLILLILIVYTTSILTIDIANVPRLKQIAQCEKELPRNQKCVLIAVPEKNNE